MYLSKVSKYTVEELASLLCTMTLYEALMNPLLDIRLQRDKASGMDKQNTFANSYKEISKEHNNTRKHK